MKFVLERVQNIVEKGEKAFSPFPTMFSKGFYYRVVKSWDCVVKTYFTGTSIEKQVLTTYINRLILPVHQLRNKFLQLILIISLDSASGNYTWSSTRTQNVWSNENPKVDTHGN